MNDQAWWKIAFSEFYSHLSNPTTEALSRSGWRILNDSVERDKLFIGLSNRYPSQEIYPIIRRDDSDSVVVFRRPEAGINGFPVLAIHDFAEAGWEIEGEWSSIDQWIECQEI